MPFDLDAIVLIFVVLAPHLKPAERCSFVLRCVRSGGCPGPRRLSTSTPELKGDVLCRDENDITHLGGLGWFSFMLLSAPAGQAQADDDKTDARA